MMMYKKAFTLIELMVVIVVIMIILMSLLWSWYWQVRDTQFRLDREKLVNTHFDLISNSISSSYYDWYKYDFLKLELKNNKSDINIYLSWDTTSNDLYSTSHLSHSYLSWFNINWDTSSSWKIVMQSYTLWCKYNTNDTIYTWWNLKFSLQASNWAKNACFDLSLDSCKLNQVECN